MQRPVVRHHYTASSQTAVKYSSIITCKQCFSALTLLVGWQEGHPTCKKKPEFWGAGVVVCLERGADLHIAQLMPLPPTVFCFSKIQIGLTFLVPDHPGIPGQRAVKRVCVYNMQTVILSYILCKSLTLVSTVSSSLSWWASSVQTGRVK